MGFMDRVKKFLGISTNDDIVAKPVEEPIVKLHNTEDGYKFEYADTNKEDKDENDNVKELVQTSEYDALIDKAKNKILAGINKVLGFLLDIRTMKQRSLLIQLSINAVLLLRSIVFAL